jgi:hypothetical protein
MPLSAYSLHGRAAAYGRVMDITLKDRLLIVKIKVRRTKDLFFPLTYKFEMTAESPSGHTPLLSNTEWKVGRDCIERCQ